MEDKNKKREELEIAFYFIAILTMLIAVFSAIKYKNPFGAMMFLLFDVLVLLIPLRICINKCYGKSCKEIWKQANVEDLYIGEKVLVIQFKDEDIVGGYNYNSIFRVREIYDDYISLIDEANPDSIGRSFTEYIFRKEELENNIMILS